MLRSLHQETFEPRPVARGHRSPDLIKAVLHRLRRCLDLGATGLLPALRHQTQIRFTHHVHKSPDHANMIAHHRVCWWATLRIVTANPTSFTRVRNLTPHAIHLIGDERILELPPDGPPARLALAPDLPDGTIVIDGFPIPVMRTAATTTVVNLPDPEPGTLLLVARPVAEALAARHDLAYPHRTVRDESGVVVGCRALGRPSRP